MIRNFKDKTTELLFDGQQPKRFPADLLVVARRKLRILHRATRLDDLRAPPGNRLHALQRDRAGQHAISINDQFRICFVWRDGDAYEVEITDYH
ncbi:type II toxin-antitoxin system RelE/ParE family toxin [Bosea lathyri]|uniref:Proteic killer suppression protein n=1 Tax=Bosea lathyri TaxID=1036778 RepID=A0A1H5TKE6_9HYPH|nr:type II toxin-antitoxin system RelE/ParE family toxin [Bosea lathyri]SEF63233.1 proteic killer suppression protein [Bosea lathyri]